MSHEHPFGKQSIPRPRETVHSNTQRKGLCSPDSVNHDDQSTPEHVRGGLPIFSCRILPSVKRVQAFCSREQNSIGAARSGGRLSRFCPP